MIIERGIDYGEVLSGKDKLIYLDARWGERLESLADFDILDVLHPVNIAEQREKFMKGEIDNPEFSYADKIDIDTVEAGLQQLKKEIIEQEDNAIIKLLYR